MREFLLLSHAGRNDLQSICDYELGEFDLRMFWKGKRFTGDIPSGVKLWVGDGQKSDYPGSPLSWPIMSDGFYRSIESLVYREVQCFPAPLYDAERKGPITGYSVVNLLSVFDALDHPIDTIDDIVLKSSRVPSHSHLFRITEHRTLCFVSTEFALSLKGRGLQGMEFIKVKCL